MEHFNCLIARLSYMPWCFFYSYRISVDEWMRVLKYTLFDLHALWSTYPFFFDNWSCVNHLVVITVEYLGIIWSLSNRHCFQTCLATTYYIRLRFSLKRQGLLRLGDGWDDFDLGGQQVEQPQSVAGILGAKLVRYPAGTYSNSEMFWSIQSPACLRGFCGQMFASNRCSKPSVVDDFGVRSWLVPMKTESSSVTDVDAYRIL